MLDTTISYTLLSVNNLVIGLDEEKALVKAIKSSFPNSELTLSTRHLSENVALDMYSLIVGIILSLR
jgi:hypothetical protein